jgi:peptidoglycan hydrolase CwlO-like protein|tara:strand:- start:11479 stop:11673 length:195 start_codon:yes stop_codon:yes gene_type:complete
MNSDEYVGLAELKKQQKNLQKKVHDDLNSVIKNQAKFFDEQQNIRNSISQNKALINNLGSSQNY